MSFPNNLLSDESIPNMIKLFQINPIRVLDLTNNQIGCEGIKDLAKFLRSDLKCQIQKLVLALNNVRKEGSDELAQVISVEIIYMQTVPVLVSENYHYPNYL